MLFISIFDDDLEMIFSEFRDKLNLNGLISHILLYCMFARVNEDETEGFWSKEEVWS